jgi:hypothetical protein
MAHVFLKKIQINNLGPIIEDEIEFIPFTYLIGRNNAGKSHYLKAIELLLATRVPPVPEQIKLQRDKNKPIQIKGFFHGVENFTHLVAASNHQQKINQSIENGILTVVRILDPNDEGQFGILSSGEVYNPGGFSANLLKVLPEPITIIATADTLDELTNKQNTALSKLKKEVLSSFLLSLKEKTKHALVELDKFLHDMDSGIRSQDLIQFEEYFKQELIGEFSEVIPSVKFNLPDEEVIAKEMKIILDDGHPSEIEQKGHGLQRAALLAMLRVLAKHGARYQDRPAPIFLVGEIETFLHPYAQKLLAQTFKSLIDRYQIVTSTHSPFIITPDVIDGYRRVTKTSASGTKNRTFSLIKDINADIIKRHLERRGNLEGLFADRIILVEGDNDEGFYMKIMNIFDVQYPAGKFTLFVKVGGKQEVRQARKFYRFMGFDAVFTVCDLDYIFSNDFKNLLKEIEFDENLSIKLREYIEWDNPGDPPLKLVCEKIETKGLPDFFQTLCDNLKKYQVYILGKGAPEMYLKNNLGQKTGWENITSADDLLEPAYLKELLEELMEE